MSAPGKNASKGALSVSDPSSFEIRSAVVIDQWELFRLGVSLVLEQLNVHVVAHSVRAGEGLRVVRDGTADLLIVGKHTDLKHQHALREAKKQRPSLRVMMLLDQAESNDVARLLSLGADALLLRMATGDELTDAVLRLMEGERVVATALAMGTMGVVGPTMGLGEEDAVKRSGLSRKELEVLAELATGATYDEIAAALIVTRATVKTHLVHIYAKLQVKNRHEAVARALSLGILS